MYLNFIMFLLVLIKVFPKQTEGHGEKKNVLMEYIANPCYEWIDLEQGRKVVIVFVPSEIFSILLLSRWVGGECMCAYGHVCTSAIVSIWKIYVVKLNQKL